MINKESLKLEPKIKIKTNNPEMPEFISIKPLSSELFEEHFKKYEETRINKKGEN